MSLSDTVSNTAMLPANYYSLEQTRRNRLLQNICLIAGTAQPLKLIITLIVWWFDGEELLGIYSVASFIGILCIFGSYYLSKQGQYKASCWLLISILTADLSFGSWIIGVDVPIIVFPIGIIVLAVVLMEIWKILLLTAYWTVFEVALYYSTPPIIFPKEVLTVISLLLIVINFPIILALLIIPARSLLTAVQNQTIQVQKALIQREKAEEQLQQQFQQLQIIYELANTVSRAETTRQIYEESLNALIHTLHPDRAAIIIYEAKGGIRFKAWHGFSEGFRAVIIEHLSTATDSDNQPVLVSDIRENPYLKTLEEASIKEGIRALAFVPVLGQGRQLGKIMLCYNNVHTLHNEDIQLSQTIANQMAFAIERKSTEEALRKTETKYRSLIEQIPAITFTTSLGKDSRITYISPQIVPTLGFTAEEWMNSPVLWQQQLHPDDINWVSKELFNCMKNGLPFRAEYRHLRRDGQVVWVRGETAVLHDDNEQPYLMQGIILDITDQKKAEEALRESEERLRLALKAGDMGIWDWELPTNTIVWSDNMEQMLGLSSDRLAQNYETFLEMIHVDDREMVQQTISQSLKEGTEYSIECRIVRPDQNIHWILAKGQIFKDHLGQSVRMLGVMTDITEHKQFENELQKVQKLESLGVLAGGIAHDFNNILTGIVGNISLARLEGENKVKLEELLQEAENAAFHAKGLTQQLLIFSKGGAPVKKTSSLKALLQESANFALRGSNVRCVFSIPKELWPVEIDKGQIGQVINNLVINADQAMPEGGTITISAENIEAKNRDLTLPLKNQDFVKITIEDEGIGISEKNLSRIFDPYFTTKQKGSGLGLATSFTIVKKHDGFLKAESMLGKGTAFVIYLPAAIDRDKAIKQPDQQELVKGQGSILVMDDEKMIRDLLKRSLTLSGYEVDVAEDGAQAVELYQQAMLQAHPYTTVIMDLTIPGGMGGKEAIKLLLEMDPKVKAVVASGYSSDPVMANYSEYGFCGALSKPYRIQEIAQKIAEINSLPN